MFLRPRAVGKVESNSRGDTFELDSHADTTCLGGGALKLFDYNCPVNVHGYDAALGMRQYQTISGAVAYDHPHTGQRYHIIVHQAIHMPDLEHHLLCPMQCRANGIEINEPNFDRYIYF